jgi:hypothetical protein
LSFSLIDKIVDPIAGLSKNAVGGHTYAARLYGYVTDWDGRPLADVLLTFTAPVTGPSGTFASRRSVTVGTNADGMGIAPTFTANKKTGTFQVIVVAHGAPAPNFIDLTNLLKVG